MRLELQAYDLKSKFPAVKWTCWKFCENHQKHAKDIKTIRILQSLTCIQGNANEQWKITCKYSNEKTDQNNTNLKTEESADITKFKQEERAKQKAYFDRGTRPLRPLNINENIRIRDNGSWSKPATVIRVDDQAPHSYIVRSEEGSVLRCNWYHLKPVPPPQDELEPDATEPVHEPPPSPVRMDSPKVLSPMKISVESPAPLRRSTGVSRPLKRLIEEKEDWTTKFIWILL